MVYAGIDYGEKKIGIAFSDTGGNIAFPHSIISNDANTPTVLAHLFSEKQVATIVMGDGRTFSGAGNPITKEIEQFSERLKKETGLPVVPQNEAGTTGAAHAGVGEHTPRGEVSRVREKEREVDAHAAALILQRFLDTSRVIQ